MTAGTAAPRRVTPTARLVLPASADRLEWLAARRQGLGSSDVASVLGVGYNTPSAVYYDKRGLLPLDADDAGEPARWGQVFEAPIAAEWTARNRTVTRRVGLVAHVDEPWMLCTLDRLVRECPLSRGHEVTDRCALEIKTRSAYKAKMWRHAVPDDVLAQGLWQIIVTGYDHVHVMAVLGGNDPRQHVIRRVDHEDTLTNIVAAMRAFWFDHVAAGVLPDLDESEPDDEIRALDAAYRERDGVVRLDDDPTVTDVLADYEAARREEKAAKLRKKDAAAKLRRRLGSAQYAVLGDQLAYSLTKAVRRSVPGDVLDVFAEIDPAGYVQTVKETTSWRLTLAASYREGDDE